MALKLVGRILSNYIILFLVFHIHKKVIDFMVNFFIFEK